MTVNLYSGMLVVKEIKKPTNAKFFKNIHLGDQLEITYSLKGTAGGSNGLYASDFKVVNYIRDDKIIISGNNLLNRLQNFELETL